MAERVRGQRIPRCCESTRSRAPAQRTVVAHSAGESITGLAGAYGSHCGGNTDDTNAYGMKLLFKATSLDPSLIESHYLKNKMKLAR